MTRYLVGISGFKRSGKNTFADVLRNVAHERGLAFVAVAFADPLRRAAAAAYGVDVSNFTDDAKKDTVCEAWGITYRQMLINLGEAMRSVDADHWVKTLRQQVLSLPEQHFQGRASPWAAGTYHDVLVAVTDVRRVNEAAAVHDLSGVNVLVRRPGVVWDGHVNEELMQKAALIGIEALRYDDYPSMRRPHNPAIFDYALDNDAATVDDAMKAMRRHAEVVVEMATRQQSRSN